MAKPFTFVRHHIFDSQCDELLEREPAFESRLRNQIRLARHDPFGGSSLKGCPRQLQNRLFKRYVGNNKEYRLFYLVFQEQSVVLGVFLTVMRRDHFDYSKHTPWELFTEALEDFNDQKMESFRLFEEDQGS